MTFQYKSKAHFLYAASHNELHNMGVTIKAGSDFEEYRELLAIARPDHALGEPFEPTKYALTEQNAMWMVGYNEDGDIIHTQAMKTVPTLHMSLGDYLSRNLREFEPSGMDIDYNKTVYRAGPGAARMKGTIVYHGEFWVGGSPRRGALLSPVLGKHAFLPALDHWRPDYTFGFIAKSLAFKGFSARFGFMHNEPNAVKYAIHGSTDTFEGTMGYMSSEDLHYVLDLPYAEQIPTAA